MDKKIEERINCQIGKQKEEISNWLNDMDQELKGMGNQLNDM